MTISDPGFRLGLLGRKVGMMRIFTDDGDAIPVTVLDVSNNRVTQVKTPETDGYTALQIVFGERHLVKNVDVAAHGFITAQMRQVAFYPSFFNTTTEPAIRLAERLAKLAPARLQHTIFCNSGSEANETALKIIRGYWKLRGQSQRTKILSREFSYHGVTIATTSMTGLASCTAPFDLPLPGFIQVPAPHAYAAGTDWTYSQARNSISFVSVFPDPLSVVNITYDVLSTSGDSTVEQTDTAAP